MDKVPTGDRSLRSEASGRMIIGRYALYSEIATGGMASVHIGRLLGPVGFSRTVAVKRLHPQFARDPQFVTMFLDEARLAARVRHPNVVSVLDVVALEGELFLVMEYIQGESLSKLIATLRGQKQAIPGRLVVAVMAGAMHGLHAAHEARSERGLPLNIVHRDVSPQNILVGVDGTARVLDFGIAKAANRMQDTQDGQLKGKLRYMAPEQVKMGTVDRRTDVYAASVVTWEALTGEALVPQGEPAGMLMAILDGARKEPSAVNRLVPPALSEIVMRGLSPNPKDRFPTARDMALALEKAMTPATAAEIGTWVEKTAAKSLQKRANRLAEIESEMDVDVGDFDPALVAGRQAQRQDSLADDVVDDPPEALSDRPRLPRSPLAGETDFDPDGEEWDEPVPPRSRKGWALGASVIVLILVGGVVAWALSRGGTKPPVDAAVSSPSAPPSLFAASASASVGAPTDTAVAPPTASATAEASAPATARPRTTPPRTVKTSKPTEPSSVPRTGFDDLIRR